MSDVLRMFSRSTGFTFKFNTNEFYGVKIDLNDPVTKEIIGREAPWSEQLSQLLSLTGFTFRQDATTTNVYHVIKAR